jgi:ABC-type amino acid transport substrate-binding protein
MLRKMAFAVCLEFIATATSAAIAQDFRSEAVPFFDNCGDGSLQHAQHDGITLGISSSPPYSSLDPTTKKASGIDVQINEAALKWLGITKVRYEVMPFGQLIPTMLSHRIASHRIDVVAANIHITPDRLKAVSFSGPACWYGRAIVTQKTDTAVPHSFEELKGKHVGAPSRDPRRTSISARSA